jgi:hypothetical protein
MAAKNNLKPKAYAKNAIDRWSHLNGYELKSLDEYTRDQIRALASKYGVKRYSSYKDMTELAKVVSETEGFKQAGKKEGYQTIFEKIKEKANGENKSLTWYKTTLKTLSAGIQTEPSRMNEQEKFDSISALVNQDQNVNRRRVFPGHLCFFEYKAETPSLPYYDKYPLVYIFKVSGGEFWGANLHYLRSSKNRRMEVIDKLSQGKIDIPKVIIHKYLYKRCKSLFLDIAKQDWEFASALPVEDFVLMKGGGRIEYPKEYVWEEIDQHWNDRIKGTRIVKGINRKDVERVK